MSAGDEGDGEQAAERDAGESVATRNGGISEQGAVEDDERKAGEPEGGEGQGAGE